MSCSSIWTSVREEGEGGGGCEEWVKIMGGGDQG